ncbi:phage tail tube protein [Xylophilus ampelinus]|uniref:Uncharacterized protein n=1 Tax=Xylophilus ampelinus TaxID=54067 RepID=A0A318SLE3_9BURK|nr:hypothetical protein [Xylophilus ampelinus]MCS4509136.1 hypothetical protein [Xylophilus ampelinus]PYE79836.1 hypothetical protein DFQ15_101156 [Xylophilus ampelinus]
MASTARAILAAGLVSLNLWDPAQQKFLGFGQQLDADKFEIKPDYEEKTSTSRSHIDYGQARASVVLPKPTEITIELAAANKEALAMQFQGIVQQINQPAETVADEALVAKLGVPVKLANRNLSAVGFAVKNDAGTTTYKQGLDYEINWARGEVRALAAGAIVEAEALKVSYTAIAVDGARILGGRNPQVRCQARFDGKNMVDGSALEADVWEAVLGSNNGFDFLAADFTNITLSGKVVTPAGKTEGYEVRTF